MFKGPVPPVVSFSMGSLGFMTPFRILLIEDAFGFFALKSEQPCSKTKALTVLSVRP